MEPLQTDTLYLAATRPAMFMGVPLALGAIFLMLIGFIVVLFKDPLYLIIALPLWFAARELVARDYNAVGVVLLYVRTAGRSVDSRKWGGASVTPHPIRLHNRGRGMLGEWMINAFIDGGAMADKARVREGIVCDGKISGISSNQKIKERMAGKDMASGCVVSERVASASMNRKILDAWG